MMGTSQSRHLAQIVGDGLGLPALFRMDAGVGAVGIDQGEDRAAEFFRKLHHPDRFAIALRMRRAEVAVDALLHVAALLGGDDQHFFAVKPRHAADDGGVVAKAAIAVNFAEIGEDALDVVERLRTLRMPRQFGLSPRRWEARSSAAAASQCDPAVWRSDGGSHRRRRETPVAAT